MAFDAFLMFSKSTNANPVKGETLDELHKGAVEISEFGFGVEHEKLSIGSASGGGGAGKAMFKEFTCKKVVDTASGPLFKTCVVGGHYQNVKLFIRKAGGTTTGKAYLVFVFGTLMIKSINWSGSTGDDVPTEEVVFEYGQIYFKYMKQDKDGKLTFGDEALWDRVTNTDKTPSGFDKTDAVPQV